MHESTPELPQRKRLRLPGFDYGKGHIYFITLCTHNRERLFGSITVERIMLNPAGEMLVRVWEGMPEIVPGMLLDDYIVMPDHFHAIFALIDAQDGPGQGPAPTRGMISSLPGIIRRFKTLVMRDYGRGVVERGWARYGSQLWQRGYHEHVIRDDEDLQAHREYVTNNPRTWQMELEHQS